MDLFNWVAPHYDRMFRFTDPAQLLAFLEAGPNHRLLDVGGGTGRVTSALAEHVGQACIIDNSPGMLLQAREKGLCAYRGVAEYLPFPDATFDRILIVDAFHHFHDWPWAAAELCACCVPAAG